MLIRHLVATLERTAVYLPAESCGLGVIEAIQKKLILQIRDPNYSPQGSRTSMSCFR